VSENTSNSKIEDYIIECDLPFEKVDENIWVIHDVAEHIDNIVVHQDETNVVFRVKVMQLPESNRQEFFETLLKKNSMSMTHGAYALDEEGNVVILDTLELENLDPNEFQASIDSVIMAITQDYKELIKYLKR
jgi:hypothetical protein